LNSPLFVFSFSLRIRTTTILFFRGSPSKAMVTVLFFPRLCPLSFSASRTLPCPLYHALADDALKGTLSHEIAGFFRKTLGRWPAGPRPFPFIPFFSFFVFFGGPDCFEGAPLRDRSREVPFPSALKKGIVVELVQGTFPKRSYPPSLLGIEGVETYSERPG